MTAVPNGNLRRPVALCDFARTLDLGNGLFQHLLVELEADFANMAGLFLAKQIAGTADIHVMACELEAGAERVERLQHFEPAFCGVGQLVGR